VCHSPSREPPSHTRGIRVGGVRLLRPLGSTPACAGNIRLPRRPESPGRSHPHVSGEYVIRGAITLYDAEPPPLARGIHEVAQNPHVRVGSTPARAGNTQGRQGQLPIGRVHSRSRGEYMNTYATIAYSGGSPPRARGIRGWKSDPCRAQRVTPACAGNTLRQPVTPW
jgi:hypothetical protein